jgi:4-hydroxybenzoate polyprenyltransferase
MLERIQLIRPWNIVMVALAQFTVFYHFIESGPADSIPAFFVIMSTCLTAASGYVINDLYDIKTDLMNAPHRPLVSGTIKKEQAIILYLVLVFSSIFTASYVNHAYWIYLICTMQLGLWWYAARLKRTVLLGNLWVSLSVAMSLLTPLLLLEKEAINLSVSLAIFAFLSTLSREIFKTIQDHEGDTMAKFNTVSVVWGRPTSMKWAGFMALLCGLMTPWLLHHSLCLTEQPPIVKAVLVIGVAMILTIIGITSIITSKKNIHFKASSARYARILKYCMLLILLVVVVFF